MAFSSFSTFVVGKQLFSYYIFFLHSLALHIYVFVQTYPMRLFGNSMMANQYCNTFNFPYLSIYLFRVHCGTGLEPMPSSSHGQVTIHWQKCTRNHMLKAFMVVHEQALIEHVELCYFHDLVTDGEHEQHEEAKKNNTQVGG